MTSPALALRAAIRAACSPDPGLAALMGGSAEIHDEPPQGTIPVHAMFGDAITRDWSDSGGRGHEQDVAVVVWAKPGSAASGLAAAERIARLLDDAPLALTGHRLVHLAVRAVESDRDRDTNLVRVTVRLRAVTEVAG